MSLRDNPDSLLQLSNYCVGKIQHHPTLDSCKAINNIIKDGCIEGIYAEIVHIVATYTRANVDACVDEHGYLSIKSELISELSTLFAGIDVGDYSYIPAMFDYVWYRKVDTEACPKYFRLIMDSIKCVPFVNVQRYVATLLLRIIIVQPININRKCVDILVEVTNLLNSIGTEMTQSIYFFNWQGGTND